LGKLTDLANLKRRGLALLALLASLLTASVAEEAGSSLPGMPPVINSANVYSEARASNFSPAVAGFPDLVYVPNSGSNTVDVIDPHTFRVVDHFMVGKQPQHVTPSYDLKTLWVLNDWNNTLTKIDPAKGTKVETITVPDPYNMYYTPDGKYAIVVAERLQRLDFRDPATMALITSLPVPCRGIDHMDFSANGRYLIASCEFSGTLVKVNVTNRSIAGTLTVPTYQEPGKMSDAAMEHPSARAAARLKYNQKQSPSGTMLQDVKLSPDGKVFYVADMLAGGVHLIDGDGLAPIGFVPTGRGAHGLYPSRDAKMLYVSNRDEGTVSVISFAERAVVQKWVIPNGGSPDMGGVSADGKILWLSGRYDSEVYAIDTSNGHLLARIRVGKGPHGLCVYPQPGRYSLGHTGVLR
jgi:YVTN family beta-propeller protein